MAGSQVSQERFDEIRGPLGEFYERALTIFSNFGGHCSRNVSLIFQYAVEQEKVEEVLGILEEHWKNYLQGVHLDLRGMQQDAEGVNPTKAVFYQIYQEILGLDVI